MTQPSPAEYAPFYQTYINHVDTKAINDTLADQLQTTIAFFQAIPDEQAGFRYAPGKWSVREVIGHLSDTERVMTYRALHVARGDQKPLPGFDENQYVAEADFDERSLASLIEEWETVRKASINFFKHIKPPGDERRGVANGHPVSVRALAYIIVGHTTHHRSILEERYLMG